MVVGIATDVVVGIATDVVVGIPGTSGVVVEDRTAVVATRVPVAATVELCGARAVGEGIQQK